MNDKILTVEKLTFVEWLELELNQRGWRPSDLARAAGVSSATISNVMTGSRNAGSDLCRGIAKAFGEPEEKVFRLAGLLSPLSGLEDEVSYRELYELWKALSTDDRRMLREFATYRYKTARDSSPDD